MTDSSKTRQRDAQAPGCDKDLGGLARGKSTSYQCSLPNVQVDLTNVAVVTGSLPTGLVVTDNDSADVEVVNKLYLPVVMRNG